MSEIDFLGETNGAGQLLLKLVSRGNALIAELMRLSENIPRAFYPGNVPSYENLTFDFSYLRNEELYEHRIGEDADLNERDHILKETHMKILKRFYNEFEGILNYHRDLIRYLSELEDGVFVQLSLEILLDNEDGKQLMCEAIYIWCTLLILLDELIPGETREKIIMSNYRYRGPVELPNIDDVCKLCKSTGYVSARALRNINNLQTLANPNKRPSGYPLDYFSRYPIPSHVISLVLGRLRSDDIYSAVRSYPQPEHRSTALSTQAAMLYTILYLAPDILKREDAVMREIVDKFFPDNWIITFYLGFTVDLTYVWEPFKAARAAIANTANVQNVTKVSEIHWGSVERLNSELRVYLTEGMMSEDFILDHLFKLLNCVRNCNVAIRWLLLHTSSANTNKKLRELVSINPKTGGGPEFLNRILTLLLDTAQFEFIMKNVITEILDSKETRWNECKREASTRMDELGNFFSGETALSRVQANKHLEKWFHDIAREIDSLDCNESAVASGRKMQQLRQALQEVEQYHDLETSLQVRSFLGDVRKYIEQMLRVVNVGNNVLGILGLVSDLSYAWDVLRSGNAYIQLMQDRIKDSPSLMLKLRSVLVKLSSILNTPLVRISQAESKDLVSVSAYFSGELISYVRTVLDVIPKTVFQLLDAIIQLQTSSIPELSAKVEKDQIRDFAKLESRFKLSQLTYAISVFTEGILAMETTLVGIDRMIPKQMLEDGIRKELVRRVSSALDSTLVFETGKIDEFNLRLRSVAQQLDGYCRSFQYIQDYIRLQGLQVWQEEFMRIVNFYVEKECAAFLLKHDEDLESVYQSREVPIPEFPPRDSSSVNFSGRLARALLSLTDYHSTLYIPDTFTWYEATTSAAAKPLVGPETLQLLLDSVNVYGVSGLDEFYCFRIVKSLRDTLTQTERSLKADKGLTTFISEKYGMLVPFQTIPTAAVKLFEQIVKTTKLLQQPLLDGMAFVGQVQLIRERLASTLHLACKTDAGHLYSVLSTFNSSLLKDVRAHYMDPDNMPYPDQESPLLPELSKYLETAGISDALMKIYVTTDGLDTLPLLIFASLLSSLSGYQFNPMLGVLVPLARREKQRKDATALAVGAATLLRQFHSSHMLAFVGICGQYVRSQLNTLGFSTGGQKTLAIDQVPVETTNLLFFLESFLPYARLSRDAVDSVLPPMLFQILKKF